MIVVLSPAKALDYRTPPTLAEHSQPVFLEQSRLLVDRLRRLSPAEIASLMKISDQLAVLNATRYAEWAEPFTPSNAKQAILAFNGDVYAGWMPFRCRPTICISRRRGCASCRVCTVCCGRST
jgi:cytoplasmic iron level regulating protein YaaA (DUF328/UPF0246 family)